MDTSKIPDLGIDWNQLLEMAQTKGIDFGINLAMALAIYFVGKFVISLVVRGIHKAIIFLGLYFLLLPYLPGSPECKRSTRCRLPHPRNS